MNYSDKIICLYKYIKIRLIKLLKIIYYEMGGLVYKHINVFEFNFLIDSLNLLEASIQVRLLKFLAKLTLKKYYFLSLVIRVFLYMHQTQYFLTSFKYLFFYYPLSTINHD